MQQKPSEYQIVRLKDSGVFKVRSMQKISVLLLFLMITLHSISQDQDTTKFFIGANESVSIHCSSGFKRIDSLLCIQNDTLPKYRVYIEVDSKEEYKVLILGTPKCGGQYCSIKSYIELELAMLISNSIVYHEESLELPYRSVFSFTLFE